MEWLSNLLSAAMKPLQWWIVIAPWEAALRVRLGKTADVLGPGIHLRIPFIDRIFVQSVRLRNIADSGQTMTTRDRAVVTIAVSVEYAIADIRSLYMSLANPESTMLQRVQGLVAEVVSRTDSQALHPKMLQEAVGNGLPGKEWGLDQVRIWVTTFAFVRTYRLIQNEFKQFSMGDLDQVLCNAGERLR